MLARALALLAPPLCGTCGDPCGSAEPLCSDCRRAIGRERGGTAQFAGVRVTWAAPYAGVARDLVAALKFGRRLQLAAVAAEAMAPTLDATPPTAVVPVPAAPSRHRHRGFDPADLIAVALARRLDLPMSRVLRRADGPRQVGRRRRERLAAPPRVRVVSRARDRVVVVDDVFTTGATLAACATALRDAGSGEIHAAVFAHALGDAARAP